MTHIQSFGMPSNEAFPPTKYFDLPIEAMAFTVATVVAYFFNSTATPALAGISIGLLTSGLVLNVLNLCNPRLVIQLTKEACKLVKQYPRLQLVSSLFALTMCFFSPCLGFSVGYLLGTFGAIILDVEKYKQIQLANRLQEQLYSRQNKHAQY